jgi:hypothetical protein
MLTISNVIITTTVGTAACTAVDPSIIDNDDENEKPSSAAAALCDGCYIRSECLTAGLSLPLSLDYGIWGGTTSYQRAKMKEYQGAKRMKPRCPGCKSTVIINNGKRTICLDCEISWHE